MPMPLTVEYTRIRSHGPGLAHQVEASRSNDQANWFTIMYYVPSSPYSVSRTNRGPVKPMRPRPVVCVTSVPAPNQPRDTEPSYGILRATTPCTSYRVATRREDDGA